MNEHNYRKLGGDFIERELLDHLDRISRADTSDSLLMLAKELQARLLEVQEKADDE